MVNAARALQWNHPLHQPPESYRERSNGIIPSTNPQSLTESGPTRGSAVLSAARGCARPCAEMLMGWQGC
eukprot:357322-Chlamydomonas_euryale.AAC.5